VPEWVWLAAHNQYRDLETGRWLSFAQARQWSTEAAEVSGDAIAGLAELLNTDRLSVHDWTLLMRDEIKDTYVQEYLLGRGGVDQMTRQDWGSIGGMLQEQYRYLDRFARQIADGEVSPGRIVQRARMYANSAREAYYRAHERALGMPPLPDRPGSGNTVCKTNCKCDWDIEAIRENGRVVRWECYWRLRPAEHCTSDEVDAQGRPLGCIQRAALWNPLVLTPTAEKGGPKSGYRRPHYGRPGRIGGSRPRSQQTDDEPAREEQPKVEYDAWGRPIGGFTGIERLSVTKLTETRRSELLKEVGTWPEDRRTMAEAAASTWSKKQQISLYLMRLRGELVGIASFGIWEEDQVAVHFMATKRPGFGRTLFTHILQEATEDGKGLYAFATAHSKGFYKHIGIPVDEDLLKIDLTVDQVLQWLDTGAVATKVVDEEPEDGIFLLWPTEEGEKGGPGSGHHEHEGRPGHVGGSKPSGRAEEPPSVPERQMELLPLKDIPRTEVPSELRPKGNIEAPEERMKLWLTGGIYTLDLSTMKLNQFFREWCAGRTVLIECWNHADHKIRAQIKMQLIERLAERSGVPEDVINNMISSWAETSNDEHPLSLLIQYAASQEFDLMLSDWQDEKIDYLGGIEAIIEETTASWGDEYTLENARRYIRAVYDETQDQLKALGLRKSDKVLLFRGGSIAWQHGDIPELGLVHYYDGNAIESWSLSYNVAQQFEKEHPNLGAEWGPAGEPDYYDRLGATVSAWVPVGNIIATALTGMGCYREGEIVIAPLGSAEHIGYPEALIEGVQVTLTREQEVVEEVVEEEKYADVGYTADVVKYWQEHGKYGAKKAADKGRIVINNELSDDWMKTLPGYQDELAIHQALAEVFGAPGEKPAPKATGES
jgi:hypothetical protein